MSFQRSVLAVAALVLVSSPSASFAAVPAASTAAPEAPLDRVVGLLEGAAVPALPAWTLSEAVQEVDARLGWDRDPSALAALDQLPTAMSLVTARLLTVLAWAHDERDAAYAAVTDEEILMWLGADHAPEAQAVAARADAARVRAAAAVVAAEAQIALPHLARISAALPSLPAPHAAPPLVDLAPALIVDPLGQANLYDRDAALLIDLGGDDVYDNNAGGAMIHVSPVADPSTCQFNFGLVAVGCENHDSFLSFTAALAIDVAGHDQYGVRKSPKFGDAACTTEPIIRRVVIQGAGSGGIGILVDATGHDRYDGKTLTQGNGHIAGVGVLVDLEGDDEYRAIRSAQGSGVLDGTGIFVDALGNDQHIFAAPVGGIRNVDQGRCDASARLGLGAGVLMATGHFHDADGNDVYRIQSQALGFGDAGVGTFVDADGADDYGGYPGRGDDVILPSGTGLFLDAEVLP